MDEAGNTIELFSDMDEISIEYDNVSSIAYRFSILEPAGERNHLELMCLDDRLAFEMSSFFEMSYDDQTEIDHETGEFEEPS